MPAKSTRIRLLCTKHGAKKSWILKKTFFFREENVVKTFNRPTGNPQRIVGSNNECTLKFFSRKLLLDTPMVFCTTKLCTAQFKTMRSLQEDIDSRTYGISSPCEPLSVLQPQIPIFLLKYKRVLNLYNCESVIEVRISTNAKKGVDFYFFSVCPSDKF